MPRTRQLRPRQLAPPFLTSPPAPKSDLRPTVGPRGAGLQSRRVPSRHYSHRQNSARASVSVRWETRR
eukprot:14483523-Alexandrium_andersonii.AAC.1